MVPVNCWWRQEEVEVDQTEFSITMNSMECRLNEGGIRLVLEDRMDRMGIMEDCIPVIPAEVGTAECLQALVVEDLVEGVVVIIMLPAEPEATLVEGAPVASLKLVEGVAPTIPELIKLVFRE
jgi:hypothetical protein